MSYKDNVRYQVGPIIKAYLDSKGIRQKHVADKIGMTLSAFSARMNGFTEITATELYEICDDQQVSADTFNPSKSTKGGSQHEHHTDNAGTDHP